MIFAILFTTGLFITIAVVGLVCIFLGRMMGDVGPYWTLLLGGILVWVAIDMLGIAKCALPGNTLARLQIKGLAGAFVLGLAYGILSGSCTFGFIAPILAIITVQEKIATGILLLLIFAIGHYLPKAIAGSSATTVKRLIENSSFQQGGIWFRRCAGILIGALGIYFILLPWMPFQSVFPQKRREGWRLLNTIMRCPENNGYSNSCRNQSIPFSLLFV